MASILLFSLVLLQSAAANTSGVTATKTPSAVNPSTAKNSDTDSAALTNLKRIYVDTFGDDPVSKEMQSMVVSALVESKHFRVTENRERADAVLKGVALETSSQELHAFGESTAIRNAAISDSSSHTETIERARLAIRLVNPDGDVLWTTTQESKGAKYKGAAADVADMCVKQLIRDVNRIEATASGPKSQ